MAQRLIGHLAGMTAPSPPVPRYLPSAAVAHLIRDFWIPVWDIPEGQSWTQHTLQKPSSLVVISESYARFYGVSSGLSQVELTGRGWAFGVTLRPSAGLPVARAPMDRYRDRWVELNSITTLPGDELAAGVRAAMTPAPDDEASHRRAIALVEAAFAHLPALDEEGELIEAIVDFVDDNPEVLRVGDLLEQFELTERTLQRLTSRRIGISPKWLIQRRRIREATHRVAMNGSSLAELAQRLGYADQAHFTRDFTTVVGLAPRQFLEAVRSRESVAAVD